MKYKIYAELTEFFSDGEKNPLLNVVIGLAALSGVLLFIVVAVVVLICKMRSTDRNVIKKDFNPLYGMDYDGEEVNCFHSIVYFLPQDSHNQAGSAREEAENKEDPPRPKSVDNQYDYMDN